MTEEHENYHSKYILTLVFASIILASFGIISHSAFADSVVTTIPLASGITDIATNQNTNKIYAVGSGTVTVIDGVTDTISTTIPIVGAGFVDVNSNTNKIYVTNSGCNCVYVIDGSTNQILTTIDISFTPRDLAVNPVTNMIYVPSTGYDCSIRCGPVGMLEVIDGNTNTVITTINHLSPQLTSVVVNPTTNEIYVGDYESNIVVIDGATNTVLTNIPIPGSLMAINQNTDRLYATQGYSTMNVVDTSSNTVLASIPTTSSWLIPVSVNPTTNKIYAGDQGLQSNGTTVFVIDGSTNTILQDLSVGVGPNSISVNPNTNKIYVASYMASSVTVIDGTTTLSTSSHLSINSQDNNGNPITGFYTELYADNGAQIDTGYTPTSFTLNNGQSYAVHVEDYGNYIFDHWSDTSSTNATRTISIASDDAITAVYKTVPQAPTGLTATGTLLKINLNWTAPGDNGGSSITGYMIERSNNGGSTWSTLVADTGNTDTTYSDNHVLPLKTYTYRVSAINDVGVGSPSNPSAASILSVSIPSKLTLP